MLKIIQGCFIELLLSLGLILVAYQKMELALEPWLALMVVSIYWHCPLVLRRLVISN